MDENHKLNKLNLDSAMGTRVINDENLINFNRELQSTDWNDVYSTHDADEKYNKFEEKYTFIYQNHFPLKTPKKPKRKLGGNLPEESVILKPQFDTW